MDDEEKKNKEELQALRSKIYGELMEFFKEKDYVKDGSEIVASFIALNMVLEAFHYMLSELGCTAHSLEEIRKKAEEHGREIVYSTTDKLYISKKGDA